MDSYVQKYPFSVVNSNLHVLQITETSLHPSSNTCLSSSQFFNYHFSGPAITAHGSSDLKQEIQIQTNETNTLSYKLLIYTVNTLNKITRRVYSRSCRLTAMGI
jgi:hypothetical protein